ncbi:MAG: bile acid:sodium symporter family protein, partial [Bacteroidales bacterium]|nr:bile acid:sodium symporter family protein [Bacteroidales bacterium]
IFFQVLILLGIPIVLGMLFTDLWPKAAAKIKKPFQYFSILVFIAMVGVSFANNWDLFIKYIGFVAIIVFFHNFAALSTGFFGATLFKCPQRDRRSLTIEIGIQNSGLGLLLLFNPKIFPPEVWGGFYGGMLFITAWWGIWHIISGLTVATIFKNAKLKDEK